MALRLSAPRLARWPLPLTVTLALALGLAPARAQEGMPDAPVAPNAPAATGEPGPTGPDAPPETAARATLSPTTLATAVPAASATGASCSGAYGLNADSTGRYTTTGCAATGGNLSPANVVPLASLPSAPPCQLYPSGSQPATSSIPGEAPTPIAVTSALTCQSTSSGILAPNGQVAACQLYPSASQPTTSSLSAPVAGAPLTAALSVAPPCPATSSSRGSLTGSGVPACQLYPSASQPSTSSFGAANYPVTPGPAPAQVTSPRGTLAGAGC